jgi:hypothetical protein
MKQVTLQESGAADAMASSKLLGKLQRGCAEVHADHLPVGQRQVVAELTSSTAHLDVQTVEWQTPVKTACEGRPRGAFSQSSW